MCEVGSRFGLHARVTRLIAPAALHYLMQLMSLLLLVAIAAANPVTEYRIGLRFSLSVLDVRVRTRDHMTTIEAVIDYFRPTTACCSRLIE